MAAPSLLLSEMTGIESAYYHSPRVPSVAAARALRAVGVFLAACSLLGLHPALPQPTASDDQKALVQLVQEFYAAYAREDLDRFLSFWTHT